LAKVEVDEVSGFVGDVRTEVSPHDAMPRRVVLLVKLLLNVGSNVLLNVVFFECLGCAVDGVLLHLLAHVGILDHRLSVSHCDLLMRVCDVR